MFIYFGKFSSVCFSLPFPVFRKLNKVFVMRLSFSEAVQKPLRNGARVTGFFFFFFEKELLCLQQREVRTNELLLHLDATVPISIMYLF